jgi:hypothetical protein
MKDMVIKSVAAGSVTVCRITLSTISEALVYFNCELHFAPERSRYALATYAPWVISDQRSPS